MAMRLLSQPEGKSRRDLDNATLELRSQELDTLIVSKRKEINDLDAMLVRTLSENGAKNYEEEKLWTEKRDHLLAEVTSLERRKDIALEPVIEREKLVSDREVALYQTQQELTLKENNLSTATLKLEERLVAFQKEENLIERQKREFGEKQKAIEASEEASLKRVLQYEQEYELLTQKQTETRNHIDRLTLEVNAIREEKKLLLIPIEERQKLLTAKEQQLVSRETSLEARIADLAGKEQILTSQIERLEHEQDEFSVRKSVLDTREREIENKEKRIELHVQKETQRLEEKAQKLQSERETWQKEADLIRAEKVALEEYKKTLVPLEIKVKDLDTKESALLKREETIGIKESDLDYTKELLEKKLDEVSEREQAALDYADTLTKRDFVVQVKEKEIETKVQALTQTLKESLESIELSKAEISKERALLKGRDVSISEREKNVALQEASFANREKAIVDRYKTLQRAITEINLKNNGNHHNKGNSV